MLPWLHGYILAMLSSIPTTQDPAGVPSFWHYQRGAAMLSILVDFWRVVCHRKEERVEVWYQWKIIRYQRCRCYFWGQVRKQYSKEGIWRHYDYSEKFFGCKQQSNWVVTLMGNEGKNKNELKVVINNGDSAMGPFCLDTNELAMLRWLGKSMRTVKIKINENA